MKTDTQKTIFLLPALTSGGAERVLITLMNNLDRTQFDPHFISVSSQGDMAKFIDPTIPIQSLDTPRVSRSIFKLYATLKELNPDIIVSTMVHMNFIVLLLKPFFPKTKFIVREAITPAFIFQDHPRIAPLLKFAYKTLYPYADLVISPAQIIVDEFREDLKMTCANHKVLHNPVDISCIRAAEDETIAMTPQRSKTVHFVAAGRLHEQKGFDRLIAALPDLKMPYEWTLTILGEGTERGALQKLIKDCALESKVTLAGHAQFPWPHYAAADCFLMPSLWEGLPNVVLEALACGTPAIVTASSGGVAEIQEYAGKDAITIVEDMDGFIAAMSMVTPSPSAAFFASLLPDHFSKTTVMARFTAMLLAR